MPATLFMSNLFGQVNLVSNPSFEDKYNCNIALSELYKAKYWNSLDSIKLVCGGDYYNACSINTNVTTTPKNVLSFQYPKTGTAYIASQFYCTSSCSSPYFRSYPKNRLVSNLVAGKVYCAKMYVNLINTCKFGIDAVQMYFGDISVDTISYCGLPLTYLTPQVSNPAGNILTDTLNWIEVSGTFTASGTEKYLLIGNFKSDAAVNKSVVDNSQADWSAFNIDDVSVIDYNLPAYAGPDKNINLGDSAFIGRPPEIGLECTWTTGTTTVGTGGGIWVKPTSLGTFSYVVTQNLCGNIKTDTVFVNMSSGVSENILFAQSIGIYPQPAKDVLNISLSNYYESSVKVKLFSIEGKEIESKELQLSDYKTSIPTQNLSNGVYILQLTNGKSQTVNKRLIITK